MDAIGFRWKGFRSLVDTGDIGLRPLTLVLGPNNSGKSSVLKPLLILKQTYSATDEAALLLRGPLVDVGSFSDVTYQGSDTPLVLAIRFEAETGPTQPIGQLAPAVLEVQFEHEPEGDWARLSSYRVYDTASRLMLSRYRLADGEYSVNLYGRAFTLNEEYRPLLDAVKHLKPSKFLFDVTEILAARYSSGVAVPAGPLPKELIAMVQTMSYTNVRISEILAEVAYIGPLREPFQRIYQKAGQSPSGVGVGGAEAPQILISRRHDAEFMHLVNAHLSKFGFKGGLEIQVSPREFGVFRLAARSTPMAPAVNVADCGFGLSQLLPFIVHAASAPEGSLLLAEQPEIHLNPRLQIELARLLAWMVQKRRLRVMVETHSEHLLNELRIRVAKGRLRSDQIQVLFVEKAERRSQVRRVEVDQNGNIDATEWPKGFFEESMSQALDLLGFQG